MNLQVAPDDLRPLVQTIVAETLQAIRDNAATLDGARLAYSEPEAAAALGVKPHVLRDARLRGEILPTKCGGRIAYERSELLRYLAAGRAAK
jgi:hypothetical protein